MKIGTIIQSHMVGKTSDMRYCIYTGIVGDYATVLVSNRGKLEKTKYHKRRFKEWIESGELEVVGYSRGLDILSEDLKKLLGA